MALVAGVAITPLAVALVSSPAGASTSSYTPATPQLATITSPAGCTGYGCAPWNLSQGDSASASYPESDLVPSYVPGGPTTTTGGTTEPNIAVYPSANSATVNVSPYSSGVVGTPGPLDDYCGTGNQAAESTPSSTPSRQPAGTTLPLAPAYFPHVVPNSDGSLTGYFDYRPKDADEALVIAKSTDGGHNWVYEGEALEQDPGYCPSADTNDDGEGHANVISVGGVSRLYTLERAAGDATGVGMLVHTLSSSVGSPSSPYGLPGSEKSGIDPDSFVPSGTATVTVSHGTSSTITVQSTGSANSPEQLIAGGFVDLTQTPVPTASSVITCTGATATTLTTCTTPSGSTVNVAAGDLIEQVIGYVSGATSVSPGPNNSIGTSGATVTVATTATGSTKGFTNALTGTTYNNNAPNRAYIDGVAVYCDQANANPTNKMEDCTTGPAGSALSAANGDPITSDPIIPSTATVTSGLVAPDGIVGTLPSYPGAPAGSTVVMYTEKELAYYVAGTTTNSSSTTFGSGSFTLTFTPSPYESADMPATISPASPVTVEMGDNTTGSTFVPVTCTGSTTGSTDTLTGCTVPTADQADKYASTSLIGAPGAALVPPSTLGLTGEGSTSAAKLFKNNEDLTVLRVAYTTDGVDFSTTGLANGGVISGGNNCGTSDPAICSSTSSYDDINNPAETVSPSNLNTYAANDSANGTAGSAGGTDLGGTADLDEMRWVGSAGSIVVNPDGSYGLFLSGAWAADGDSDSFNQIFYAQSTDGENWSVPTPVVSTDYSFSASSYQDAHPTTALGISAYYEGRAYGASVVQNPDGSLTMLFAGYRLPKTVADAGTTSVGTGSSPWTIGSTDPALYRNILVTTLSSATTPAVATTSTLTTPPTSPAVVGQSETVSATVAPVAPGTGTPTGSVAFSDGGASPLCTGTLDDSTPDTASCTYTYSGPQSSPDNVTADYVGDSNYAVSTSPAAPVTVNQDATTTSTPSASNGGSPADPAVVGEPVTLSSSVTVNAPGSGSPTGSVSFSDGGSAPLCAATLDAPTGIASCTYTPTSSTPGDEITATYGGDTNDASSTSAAALDEVVDAASTSTALTITPTAPIVGQTVTLSATVTPDAPGAGNPTGTVSFDGSGATPLCSAVLAGSPATASCTTTYTSVTSDTITATYPGDGNFVGSSASSTVSVDQAMTSTAVVPSDPAPVVGEPVTYTATVTVTPPGSGTPTGTVTFTGDGDATVCASVPVSPSGTATCQQTYTTTGADDIGAAYSGDTNFALSSSSTSVTVGQDATTTTVTASPSPAVVGEPVTVSATVAVVAPGAGTPGGTVSFADGGGSCSGTLSSSAPFVASCTTTYSSPVSGDTVTGTYSGDGNDASSSGTTAETVNQDATTTTLTSSPTSPVVGQQVTYTATVGVSSPGAGAPGGTVVFSGDGPTTYCTATLNNASPPTATCARTYAGTGSDSVSAAYGGDTDDQGSVGTEAVSIGQDATTTTAVSVSPTSPVVGQTVTLRATVAATAPGAGTPSGAVAFSGDGASCSGTLSGGSTDTASCTTSFPGATSGSLTATYGGDTDDVGSSGTTTVAVGPADTTTAVTSDPPSPVAGQSITLTATVAAKAPGAGVPTGTVTFSGAGGPLCSGGLVEGSADTASCSTTFTGGSSGTITGTYGGDADFNGSSGSVNLSVGKGASATTVTSSADPGVTGQSLTFTATVGAVAPATGTPAGTVTFAFSDPVPTKGPGHLATPSCGNGGSAADTVTLSGGSAVCTIGGLLVEQSPLTVTASYSGSTGFDSSASSTFTETVGKAPSTVTITPKLNPTVTAKTASFSAIVAAAAPGAGDPTGTATWTITSAGGTVVPCKTSNTTVNKKTGKTTCVVGPQELSAASGPYTVSVAYPGDTNFDASTGTFTQDVSQTGSKVKVTVSPPASSGSPATITATVTGTPASAGTPTGTVTFAITSISGSPVSCDTGNTATLASGSATCTVTSALVLAGSPYSVVATYGGDGNFTTSASSPRPVHVPR
ncbi:MAG: Ig-like domain repeat protein [Acidimicrobiales bacterium]